MEIQGEEIKLGESKVIELNVTKQATRNQMKIPVFVSRAKKEGPCLLLTGGVHGDELNGVAIVRDVIRQKLHKPKVGTIICIPVLNIFGFLNHSRELPDGRDLNRVIPGSPTGSLTSQLAYMYINEIAHLPDVVLDFHAGGRELVNYPNIRTTFKSEKNLALADIFDAPFTVNSKHIKKSIRNYYDEQGKTVLLFEGGKSMELDPFVIDMGIKGVKNVMIHLGMIDGNLEISGRNKRLEKSTWLRAGYFGMFQPNIENGAKVSKDEALGLILDPYGDFQKLVKAPYDMHIFGINTAPIVYKGDPLFHVSKIAKDS